MILVTWNVRGLGRSEKKRAVRRLIAKERNMIFIQESKLHEVNSRNIRFLGGNNRIKGEYVGST